MACIRLERVIQENVPFEVDDNGTMSIGELLDSQLARMAEGVGYCQGMAVEFSRDDWERWSTRQRVSVSPKSKIGETLAKKR